MSTSKKQGKVDNKPSKNIEKPDPKGSTTVR